MRDFSVNTHARACNARDGSVIPPHLARARRSAMDLTLDDLALDWRLSDPRLVHYLGRIVDAEGPKAVIAVQNGEARLAHEQVFWLGAVCGGSRAPCRLVREVGTA
jgi:hypothetical protein